MAEEMSRAEGGDQTAGAVGSRGWVVGGEGGVDVRPGAGASCLAAGEIERVAISIQGRGQGRR